MTSSTETLVTGNTTVDATPVVTYSKNVAADSMIRIDVVYQVFNDGDMSLVTSGRVVSVFSRKLGSTIARTSTTKDVAEVGDILATMGGTLPVLELVSNPTTNQVDYTLTGSPTDTLQWSINASSYIVGA